MDLVHSCGLAGLPYQLLPRPDTCFGSMTACVDTFSPHLSTLSSFSDKGTNYLAVMLETRCPPQKKKTDHP